MPDKDADPRIPIWTAIGKVSSNFARLERQLGTLFMRLMDGDDTLASRLFHRAPSVPARLELIATAFEFSRALDPRRHGADRKKLFASIQAVCAKRNKVAHAVAGAAFTDNLRTRTFGAICEKDGQSADVLAVEELLAIADEIEAVSAEITQFVKLVARETDHPSASNP